MTNRKPVKTRLQLNPRTHERVFACQYDFFSPSLAYWHSQILLLRLLTPWMAANRFKMYGGSAVPQLHLKNSFLKEALKLESTTVTFGAWLVPPSGRSILWSVESVGLWDLTRYSDLLVQQQDPGSPYSALSSLAKPPELLPMLAGARWRWIHAPHNQDKWNHI